MAQSQGAPLSRGKEVIIRDRKALFERRAETGRNPLNEPIYQWQSIGASWAAVEEVGEGEVAANGIEGAVAAIRVLVLDTPQARSITLADRLQILGQTWDLVGRGPHSVKRGVYAFVGARYDASSAAP
jgi:head-tail adaptor